MCDTCKGRGWTGEPWAPDTCTGCAKRSAADVLATDDNPWEVKA